MDPGQGFIEPEDVLELAREAEPAEPLTITDRAQATYQAGLQPFSFDVHVKLGMELLALRRQEALMQLDAEAFGEKLKRRAAIRDMLKKVAKEDSWVQYPAADLARITRALNREDMPEGEEEDVFDEEQDDDKDKGKSKVTPSYAKWLERKRRGAVRRAAFGVSVERDMGPVTKTPGASPLPGQEDIGGLAIGRRNSSTSGSTTFGKAHRLVGFPGSRPGSQHTNRRNSVTSVQTARGARSSGGYEPGQMNGGGAVGVVDYEAFAAGDGAASDTEDGEAAASGGRSPHFADIQEAAQVLGLNYKDNSRRRVVQLGGEASGPASGANSKRQLKKTQSELVAAASEAASEATGLRPTGTQSDWRSAVRSKSHCMAAPPGLQPSAAVSPTAPGELPEAPQGPPVPPVASQLAQLEAAVEAVASLKEEQLQTFITAVEVAAKAAAAAEAAAAAATAGASPEEQAAAVKAAGAAANRVLMYDEAAMSVEKLLAESAARLEQARAIYEQAHAAKLSAIAGQSELQRELQLLREWLAGAEQQRLALAAAALAAQRQRLEAAAGGPGATSSPALAKLLEQCSGAAESLGALASGLQTATAEAEANLVDRQRRREALRLIEDECVKLAEDMEQREETERLATLMKAEAEAERAMAEAKNEDEAKEHALMAALIMGEEEWVLEHQVRSAALRAAERDQQRMAVLLAAEREKAAKAGAGFDSGLLDELKELEDEAKAEIAYRRERLEEAVKELAVFAEMRRQAAERQAREAAAREAVEAEAASAAASVAASQAEAAMDPSNIQQPPPPPPPPIAVEESVASRPPSPSPPEPTPEELLQAAVAAMHDCYSHATAAAPSGLLPSAAAAAGLPPAAGDALPQEESELEKYSRAAQQRLAAARAALEAVIKLREAQKGTLSELAEMADDARRYEVAAAAVREERERVAAALAAEVDAKKSAWLAGVLDECNRLYDAMVAAGVAEPAPSAAELLEKERAAAEAAARVAAAAAVEQEAAQALAEAEAAAAAQREQEAAAAAAVADAAASAAAVTSTPISPAHTPRIMSPRPPGVTPPANGSLADEANSSPKLRAARAAAMNLSPPASQAALLQPVRGPARPTVPSMPTTVTLGFDPHTNSVTHEWSRAGHPHARTSAPHLAYGGGHLAAAAGGYTSPGPRGSIAAGSHSKLAAPYAPPPQQQQPQLSPPPLQSFTYSAPLPGGGAGGSSGTLMNGVMHSGPSGSGGLHAAQPQLHLHHAGLAPLQPPPVGGMAAGAGSAEAGSPVGGASRRSFAINGARPPGQAGEPLPPIHPSANSNSSGVAAAAASALAAHGQPGASGVGSPALPNHMQPQPPMRRSEPGMSAPQGKAGSTSAAAAQGAPNGQAAMPPQHQAFLHQQQQFYQAALVGAPGILQQYTNSPDSGSPNLASRLAGGPHQAGVAVHNVSAAGLPADALHSHLRKQVGGGSGPNSTGGDGSAGPDSGTSTPQRGQLPLRPGGLQPPQVGIVAFGDSTYTQWVAAQAEATPKALEAARQVDEVLARLPPELHSVLLNAAELLTGVGLDQASMAPPPPPPQQQALQPGSNGSSGGAAAGDGGLPPHLQSLPPVVAKYIMNQLQRIYTSNNASTSGAGKSPSGGAVQPGRALDHLLSGGAAAYAPGVAGAGADGAPQPHGSNSGMATILLPSATTGLDSSSYAALQLFNQMLPALTQSVAAVRSRLGGGFGSPAVPSSVVFEPAQRSPVGSGAMIGSQLKASRKVRPPGGAEYYEGSSGSGAIGGGSGLASQAFSQVGAQQQGGAGAGARRNSRGPAAGAGGGGGGGGGAAPFKGGAAELAQYDLLRYQQEALGGDRWTVRGVNVQVAARSSQPAAAAQQRGSGDGAAPQQGGKLAREGSKETFLPPLGKQHHAVRH